MLAQELLNEYKKANDLSKLTKRQRNKFYRNIFKNEFSYFKPIVNITDYNANIILPYDIIPASRPKVTQYSTYIEEPYNSFKKCLALSLLENVSHAKFLENLQESPPLKMDLVVYYKIPKATSNKKHHIMFDTYRVSKPDIDNLGKSVLDALEQSNLIINDSNVVSFSSTKKWGLSYSSHINLEILQ